MKNFEHTEKLKEFYNKHPYAHQRDFAINKLPFLITVSIHLSPHSSILPMTKRAALASSRLLSSGGSKGCRLPTFSLSVRASGAVCPLDFADALRVPAPPGGWLLSPPELSRPRVRLVCGGREGGAGRQLGAPWPHGPTAPPGLGAARRRPHADSGRGGPARDRYVRGERGAALVCARVRSPPPPRL